MQSVRDPPADFRDMNEERNMKQKKMISLCALLLAAGMLTACGGESSTTAECGNAETTTAASDTTAAPADTTVSPAADTTASSADTTDPSAEETAASLNETVPAESRAVSDDTFSDDMLIFLASRYYGSRNNWVPEFIDVDSTEDPDTAAIHLYDLIDNHTSTRDWYYVSRKSGSGEDFLGNPVNLNERPIEVYDPEVPQRADIPDTACCGVQYIGSFPAGTGKATGYNAALIEYLIQEGYDEEYPFLGALMNEKTFAETPSAQELYLIIPRDREAQVVVTQNDPVEGSIWGRIYSSYNGTPFLLYCNHSEIASDVQIQITDNSGVHEAFSVYLSGMDGSPKADKDCAYILTPELHKQYPD